MSFQKINGADTEIPGGRECLLVYGVNGKDLIKLKNLCTMIGIKDIIQVEKNMLGEKVENILDDHITKSECGEAPTDRTIVFNAFSGQKLHTFLENFKRTGIVRPLIASVTPTSINWTFLELILELQKERIAIAKANELVHEDINQ